MRNLLFLCILAVLLVACAEKEVQVSEKKEANELSGQIIGKWAGDIELPNAPLPILVSLQKDSGTLSVPAQGLKDYPFQNVKYDGNNVSIQIDFNGSAVEINGSLKGEQIEASFKQNGGEFPLLLKLYKEQPVSHETFTVPVENGELHVALQKSSKKPSPVALILAGSGPTDKDGNSAIAGKNDSLKMLAEGLANEGIATIRYDKRGVGENMSLIKKEEELTIDQLVDDTVKVIEAISSNKAYTSIHIIGHSEGSLIGMLATQKANVDSFVSLAGAGRAADVILLEQLAGQLTPKQITETTNILASLKKGELVENISPELEALFRPSVQPYMMSWLKYNPASVIKSIDSRTLIIQGTNDLQVTATDAKALKNSKDDAELLYMQGMNHVLKNAPADRAGNLASYNDATLPLHPELLPAIHKFIVQE